VAVVGRLYKNKKETAVYKRRNSTQNNTEIQNTQNIKQKYNKKQTYKKYF